MAKPEIIKGYSGNGLPYARIGSGKPNLVIFDAISFVHKPPSAMQLRMMGSLYNLLAESFTVYVVGRKPGLPKGYSMRDMSNDYAVMIKSEMETPVDVVGISTGGLIAQWFAIDYPELVNRLVLACSGYKLSDTGRYLQMKSGNYAREGKWRASSATMADAMFSGFTRVLFRSLFWLMGRAGWGLPEDASDGLVEIEAEDRHDFKEHLGEIKAAVLVIGGELDKFYLIPETAEGIPGARLILFKNTGHTAIMKRKFSEDILAFLKEETV